MPAALVKLSRGLCSQCFVKSLTVATARAGNVIGGGDFSKNRLIPDIIRSVFNGAKLDIRNPNSTRPWQHVLDPLNGLLRLAENIYVSGTFWDGGWNLGRTKKRW